MAIKPSSCRFALAFDLRCLIQEVLDDLVDLLWLLKLEPVSRITAGHREVLDPRSHALLHQVRHADVVLLGPDEQSRHREPSLLIRQVGLLGWAYSRQVLLVPEMRIRD